VARELNLPRFVVARKGVKAYMSGYMQVEVNSITTKGTATTDTGLPVGNPGGW